jgi:N-glycosidase YbiA
MSIDYKQLYGDNVIVFTKNDKQWGRLSNFNGNVEYKFQAEKYKHDTEHYNEILNAKTPSKAKYLGGKRGGKPLTKEQIEEWNIKRIPVMKKCIEDKFSKDSEYTKLLISTGDSYILEKAPWDSFWGGGRNGKGKNMLGQILMERRNELIKD